MESNNRRIAKNTLYLYLRMFLSIIVSLYTSRIVLHTLGVDDYGIYNVVGGIVTMFTFLNTAMASATSRFLTFEMGRINVNDGKGTKRLNATFSSALIIHIGIAIVILILAETIGMWFLCNKLVIPINRMTAAHWVYQCGIVSMMVGVTQVPYNATIIAHEKMDVYAYVELLNVFLKLGIVYLLVIGDFDKLILYAILMLAVSIITTMIYRVYCFRHYVESHFHWIWDRKILYPILSFSGWDLYGNACTSLRKQGNNFLINIFFGVLYNAASGVATTVSVVILGFANNVTQAFRPQIIKFYAQGEYQQMQLLMENSAKYMILLMGCMITPALIEMPLIMQLWLKEVPLLAPDFCRIAILMGLFELITHIMLIGIHATGHVKRIGLVVGTLYLLSLFLAYIILRLGGNQMTTFYVACGTSFVSIFPYLLIIKHNIPAFKKGAFCKQVIVSLITIVSCAVPSVVIALAMPDSIGRLIVITLLNICIIAIVAYLFIIDKTTRSIIKSKIKKILNHAKSFSNHSNI